MPKTHKVIKHNFEKTIMKKVRSKQIVMKPRWYFVLGSFLMMIGLVSFSIWAIFLTNLTFFLLRGRGPMAQWHIQNLINNFPLWVPILALAGIILGIWLLKKYDFSYKKNFLLIILGFITSIIIAGFIINYLGLNEIWSRRGMMRRFYQNIEKQENVLPNGLRKGRPPFMGQ